MKKLVYHLYISNDFDTNPFTFCNKFCLQKYINVFDDATFFIAVDDIHDKTKIDKGMSFIKDVCCDLLNPTVFVIKNDKEIREVVTFEMYILPMIEYGSDDYVLFGHNKGTSMYKYWDLKSLLTWVIILYYYNFEFMDDVIKNFEEGKPLYGSNLSDMSSRTEFDGYESKSFYSGTFYWLNMKEVRKTIESLNIDLFGNEKFKYYAELFPILFSDSQKGSYKNSIILKPETYNTYRMDDKSWNSYLLQLDDELQCVPFVNEIIEKVVNIKKN